MTEELPISKAVALPYYNYKSEFLRKNQGARINFMISYFWNRRRIAGKYDATVSARCNLGRVLISFS